MKKYLLYLLIVFMFLFSSCMKHDFNENNEQQVKDNVETVFGTNFPNNQDWCTTINSSINVFANTSENIVKVQVLMSSVKKNDSSINITSLNEANISKNEKISITFDVPENYEALFIAFINDKGQYFYKPFKIGDKEVNFNNVQKARTRSVSVSLPSDASFVINGTIETFANQRGWLPGEVFYNFDNTAYTPEVYTTDFITVFNNVIFNYFKNGRNYNNLPLIKKSGYYNESSYPITTGDEPIIVSPVYKNDGGYKEIAFADLYYYYYKGDLSVAEIEALPKYKAIDLSTVFTNEDNNVTYKRASYGLVYFGDGTPEIGTVGTYKFPIGYKIGFCYKSNTTTDNKKKQGELYGDGRLNYNINNWGNFKSSKLEATAPRMAWMTVDNRMFLCIESGTDADFNDLILEVEGGIEPIIIPPIYETNFYTFCFEDRRLGDYDMNDVVLKGTRLSETTVEWTLMATGATDELYIYNIEGEHIKNTAEVHDILGKPRGTFINTQSGDNTPYVTDIVRVAKTFSFLDVTTQPYIFDKNMNWDVHISRIGQDPHAIMIPYDFRWPLEKICINKAYLQFNSWGIGSIEDNDWYKYPEDDLIF